MGVKSVALYDPSPAQAVDLSAQVRPGTTSRGGERGRRPSPPPPPITPSSTRFPPAQFYLSPADVGHPRDVRSRDKLAALNAYVAVSVLAPSSPSSLSEPDLLPFDVIAATDLPAAEAVRLNDLARKHGKKFVLAETHGAFGRVFCDFGPSFRVDDVNDEQPTSAILASVTADAPAVVTTLEDQRHGLQDGDLVVFREVGGMAALNDGVPRRVLRVTDPHTFQLDVDARALPPYTRGGVVTMVKAPQEVTFQPLARMIGPAVGSTAAAAAGGGPPHDAFLFSDFGKLDAGPPVHAAFAALHDYKAAHGGASPAPADEAATLGIVAAAEAGLGAALSPAHRGLVRQLARCAGGQLGPLAAAVGGIAAQEVLKAVSGKFMPIRQFLYLDACEALPPPDAPLDPLDFAPAAGRYDGQIAVFGRAFQQRLLRLNYFLVGAGAIGCEMLKNWAVMGVGAGDGGSVTVTDMDRIEKSNLSRQFLFRNEDIGRAKSSTAALAAVAMNSDVRASAFELRVAPDTESTFNDEFWSRLDGVCTALDNLEARRYVDGRCVYYGKPMLESGTLGTKGNTQVVVPRLTENYGASQDPPEQGIPVCTLKNFPNKIEHTLQWARDWFEGEFRQVPDSANAYLAQPSFLEALAKQTNTRIDTLEKVHAALVTEKAITVEDCVRWARFRFADLFTNQIKQLLHNFPPDFTTTTGEPFWSGAKRMPTPIEFDAGDVGHMTFVTAATRLRASVYGLKLTTQHTPDWMRAAAAAVPVPAFEPRSGVRIAANDKELEEMKKDGGGGGGADGAGAGAGSSSSSSSAASASSSSSGSWDTEARATAIAEQLPPPRDLAGYRLGAVDFEKDDDLHITLVAACSNLRARNYKIEEADKHTSKLIAGKIIPAIATTTALVSGLICLELYKLVANKPIEAFRNCFANLSVPVFAFSEPVAVKKSTLRLEAGTTWSPPPLPGSAAASAAVALPDGGREWKWSVWDRIDLAGPMTLDQFMTFFRTELGIEPSNFCYGATPLWGPMLKPAAKRERTKANIVHLAQKLSKSALHAHVRYITIEVMGTRVSDGEDVDLPYIRYKLGPGEIAEADAQGAGAGTGPVAAPLAGAASSSNAGAGAASSASSSASSASSQGR
jgi:ubiquitin-activating enzyme E1